MSMHKESPLCATTYSLRQSLQLNPGFSDTASLSNQLTPGGGASPLPKLYNGRWAATRISVSVGSVAPSSGPHTQAINTLTTGQSP